MKKSLLIGLAFACLIIIPQNVFAGALSDPCSIATCPAGRDYYKQSGIGGCYIEINSLTDTTPSCQSVFGAPAEGKQWSFTCNDGCKQTNIPTTYSCPQHNVDMGSTAPCCEDGEVIKFNTTTSKWECTYSLDLLTELVARLLYAVGYIENADTLMNNISDLIVGFTADKGPIAYLLSHSGTPYEYRYGDVGDAGGNILLEADYADEAELAQSLNWDNYPEWTNLFENLSGVTFCNSDLDCGTGTCDNGICRGTAALGAFCDATTFCQYGLICDLDKNQCIADTGMIDPANITPGIDGQVLTTVSGETEWADAVGGVSVSTFVGVSGEGSNGSVTGGYTNVDSSCNSSFVGSHVCTAPEIIRTYVLDIATIISAPGISVWINNGPPAYTVSAPNDCNGWASDTNTSFGTSWNFGFNKGVASSCDLVQRFACCL
jgi:hypothetical protein